MINIGVIGYGYWGPNIVRNFHATDYGCVKCICDERLKALEPVQQSYPGMSITLDYHEILSSPELDAVAIITPVATHYPMVKQALENGKHVFVQKPFTRTVGEAEELIELAEKKNLTIMVDHTLLFTPAVRKIKELIDGNLLGPMYYYDSTRVNLGVFQTDINVIWDLAPHDFSIMHYLIREKPLALVATGENHVNDNEDVAYITVYFPNNLIAHFNVNWLSPVKMRRTLIGGEKKMLVWNDLEPDEKIKVYDKGASVTNREGIREFLVNYRMGDIWSPRLDQTEALKLETQCFLECIGKNEKPLNDGVAGLKVVQMLEATDALLRNKGGLVYLQ